MMDFHSFAASHGVMIDRLGHGIQRCGTAEKPRSKNGAYFFDEGRGWVCNWQTDGEVHWFHDPASRPWTEEEKRQWRARRDMQRHEQERMWQEAAKKAKKMIDAAKQETHGYLIAKGFKSALGLVLDNELLIPMRNFSDKKLQSVQRIFLEDNEWKKKMLANGKAKGGVFVIGRGAQTFLCEGYATGLSISAACKAAALSHMVMVCFSASNMAEIGRRFTNSAFVCADNDASGTGQAAAQETRLPWIMPDKTGQDFNDLHQQEGIFSVVRKVLAVRQNAPKEWAGRVSP
jgi:putative DNA primase/helicase